MITQGLRLSSMLWLVLVLSNNSFTADKPVSKSSTPAPAQKSQPTTSKKTKAPKALKYRGEITAIDIRTGAISVKGEAGEKRFMTQAPAKDTLDRFEVGDTVRVIYSEKEKKLVTSSVRRLKVKPVKSGGPPSAPSKSAPSQNRSKTQIK
jgi:ribosomal protein S1